MSPTLHEPSSVAPVGDSATPPDGSDRGSRIWRWLPAVAATTAVGVIAVRDPNEVGSYGLCPLKLATGLDCPFCGGLRGTYDLLHGHFAAALDHNLLLPLYLGVLAIVVIVATRETTSARFARWRRGNGRALTWVLVAVVLLFFVVRNLPWFPYLDAQA